MLALPTIVTLAKLAGLVSDSENGIGHPFRFAAVRGCTRIPLSSGDSRAAIAAAPRARAGSTGAAGKTGQIVSWISVLAMVPRGGIEPPTP
jgi:hypothetical protein